MVVSLLDQLGRQDGVHWGDLDLPFRPDEASICLLIGRLLHGGDGKEDRDRRGGEATGWERKRGELRRGVERGGEGRRGEERR